MASETDRTVAHASAASGEEVCVVQTFKDAEPYQVSLYAHKPGSPWVWHYLAHQDCRWRSCRLEFAEGELRVYEGSLLRKKLTLAENDGPLRGFGRRLSNIGFRPVSPGCLSCALGPAC